MKNKNKNKQTNKLLIIGDTLDLVIFGSNLTSTVGIKLKKEQLAIVQLASFQKSVIIGLVLSDGWLRFASSRSKNALLGFKQSLDHSQYILFVFNILSHYCSSSPHIIISIGAEKRYYGLEFFTRSMACLTELHSLFYPNGVKIIPNNIFDLLSPITLAHLIMGDGSSKSHGLIICTDSYTVKDVVRLINVFIIKFRLECSLYIHKQNKYRIYIKQRSMPLLLNIVSPYMHPSMLYKLKSSLSKSSNSQQIEVTDIKNNITNSYDSISEAARVLNINKSSIRTNLKSNSKKPYKNLYIFAYKK